MHVNGANPRPHARRSDHKSGKATSNEAKLAKRFEQLDVNHDGTLRKKELLKEGAARFAALDANGDGKVTRRESRLDFAKLDQDGAGSLSADEAREFARYDADGDAQVSAEEFVAGQRADRTAARRAIRDHAFDGLDGDKDGVLSKEEAKELDGYDADADGSISREEFQAGKSADWRKRTDERIETRFGRADRDGDGVLSRKEAKSFKGYDLDGDRKVSRLEFQNGQDADRRARVESGMRGGAVAADYQTAAADGIHEPTASTKPTQSKGATDLVISSFNVLGSSHTTAGGKEPGMASGPKRMHGVVDLLNQHKVDVVGFQEMQVDQVKEFQKLAGDKYGLYPGLKLGKGPNVNSIAWRKDKWDLVKADSIAIPYFNGHKVKMPVVLLRNKETGQEAYFTNFHNPADTSRFHHQERFRDQATQLEIDLVNRLKKTGRPVFMTGDMNEKMEAHDKVTRGTHMNAANDLKPKTRGIDWIFGSPDVTFSDFVHDRGERVRRTSDHPMVVAHARIDGQKQH